MIFNSSILYVLCSLRSNNLARESTISLNDPLHLLPQNKSPSWRRKPEFGPQNPGREIGDSPDDVSNPPTQHQPLDGVTCRKC